VSRAQRGLLLRGGAAVTATLALAPLLGALLDTVPFHRIMTRTFLVALVIALAVRRGPPRTWPAKLRAMGLRGPERGRRFALGCFVSLVLVAVLLVVSWAVDGRAAAEPHRVALLPHLAKACATALVVAWLEEILCRGYLLDVLGGAASALLYAAAHFMRPAAGSAPAAGYDPLLGIKRLPELFQAWGNAQNATLGLVSLFLFGLALNRLRERTGTLYLGIGLHAGLVLALALYVRILTGDPVGNPWFFGGARLHDGVLGTGMLGALLVAAYLAPLPERLRAAGSRAPRRPRPRTAGGPPAAGA
jgi:membrane protease YdiL (CAAX protease family)